jgi:hypothetical protein
MRALAPLLLLLSAACGGPAFFMRSPAHFIELDPSSPAEAGYAMRAVSADGVVVAVRAIDNSRHGSREFWTHAIQNQLGRGGGYALLDETEVRAASGEAGDHLRFGRDDDGHPYRYWVTIFATERHVFVIEIGGREERVAEVQGELEASVASFRIR